MFDEHGVTADFRSDVATSRRSEIRQDDLCAPFAFVGAHAASCAGDDGDLAERLHPGSPVYRLFSSAASLG
ncbi:hypothetical protein ASG29_15865 [Sphingomonas sp. Leaf412]|nr:hypothetical protein ASG29_15865 [Sphingomonas sp. Leaf412]